MGSYYDWIDQTALQSSINTSFSLSPIFVGWPYFKYKQFEVCRTLHNNICVMNELYL